PVQRRPRLLAYGLFRIAREKFLITIAIHLPKRRIDVDNLAVSVPERESVDGGVEHGAILFLTCEQRLLDLDALGDVPVKARLCARNLIRHCIESMPQSSKLVATTQAAARIQVTCGQLFGCADQLIGAPRQQYMEDDPQCGGQC